MKSSVTEEYEALCKRLREVELMKKKEENHQRMCENYLKGRETEKYKYKCEVYIEVLIKLQNQIIDRLKSSNEVAGNFVPFIHYQVMSEHYNKICVIMHEMRELAKEYFIEQDEDDD